ncbi:MAG: FtsX-like permease family protein [Chlorobi bacterium]|nr:FtsX-like permease family protein [Chlorobiota bacterium]
MSFEPFIALRFLKAKRRIGLISIISFISILGISIGVAALIIVLSVFNGFNSFAIKQLIGFDPHLRITSTTEATFDADDLISTLEIPDMVSATPFIEGRSAIIHEGITQVAEIRGVQRGALQHGHAYPPLDLNPLNSEDKPIILGSLLANQLRTGIGAQVSIISRRGLELALTQVAQPTTISVNVASTFSLNQEYDAYVAFTDLQTARELFDLPEGEMGIEIRLQDHQQAEPIAAGLSRSLGSSYRVETWQDLHRDLYGAMQLERWAAFAILMLIIVVAVFNVLGSLTMTVIEKQRDIGVLKAMGASDRGILRIFLYEGGLIGLLGTAIGLVLGIGICLLQQEIGFYKLDTASYLLPTLPVEMHLWDILLIAFISLVLATFAAIYPARRAARVYPAEAIRWE